MSLKVLRSIHEVAATEWNALALDGQPFLRHEFLAALEDTGCATTDTGWTPQHLLLRDATGALLGAVPLYLKSHSFGEFVFDFSWANAFEQAFAAAGQHYYPKLTAAIPFTPATGPRLLYRPGMEADALRQRLLSAVVDLAEDLHLSGAHVLFPDADDFTVLQQAGWLPRTSCQFHWFNRHYGDMEAFLATFRADKRKKARRERRRVREEFGIHYQTLHGDELTPALWQVVFGFSENTFHQHGHHHYLNATFLQRVAQALPGQVMVKLAEHQGKPVAAAIFFRSDTTLFGRYWGCSAPLDSLHFETCYYQGIEYCIEHGLQLFEPGTQGEHKIARGFEPSLSYSGHFVRDARFRQALAEYLPQEHRHVANYAAAMRQHIPFHHTEPESACRN